MKLNFILLHRTLTKRRNIFSTSRALNADIKNKSLRPIINQYNVKGSNKNKYIEWLKYKKKIEELRK
jgi:hypothetical protein